MRILYVLVALTALNAQPAEDRDVTGMTLHASKGCPLFIEGVGAGTPAERAGIHPGDRLLGVDGTRTEVAAVAGRLMARNGRSSVKLALQRNGKEIEVSTGWEKQSAMVARSGRKLMSGLVVPADTTQAEMDRLKSFETRRDIKRVFPTRYPQRPDVFYAGFEILILDELGQVVAGGMEDGPASKAGVHRGDILVSLNGTPLKGKSFTEVAQLFSSTQASTMRLQIDRLGASKTVEFQTQKAEDVARQNGKRFADDYLVPIWVTAADLHCFPR